MNIDWNQIGQALIHAGPPAAVTYVALLTIARMARRLFKMPMRLSYHFFALASGILMAWFIYRHRGGPYVDLPWLVSIHQLLIGLWAVLLAMQVNRLLTRFVWEHTFVEKRRIIVPKLLRDLVTLLLQLTAIFAVSKFVYGQELGALITASGVVAVVLGFALQNLLGDVVAGIALNLEKPFEVGDWICFGGTDGEVIEINWRATRLRTKDDNYLIIPNGTITKQEITNFNFPSPIHALKATVGVEYGAPPNRVKTILQHATAHTPGVVARTPPRVWLTQFADSSITYTIKFWIDDHAQSNEIFSSVMTNIWYALGREHISIPFPIRDVYLHKPAPVDAARQHRLQEAESALRGVELFKALDNTQVAGLATRGRILRFGRNETIIRQGDAGDSFFLIMEGQASVRLACNGQDNTVATLLANDFFGEMSLLTGAPRGATIVAEADLCVVEIQKDAISPVLKENPAIVESLSKLLAERQMANEGYFKSQHASAETDQTRERYANGILRSIRTFFRV